MKNMILKLCGRLMKLCGTKNVVVVEAGNMVISGGKIFKVSSIAIVSNGKGAVELMIEGIDLITDKERECAKVK